MIRLFVVLAVVSTLTLFHLQTAEKSNDLGWTSLFDGRSLTGWTPEQTAQWHVSGGLIVGDALCSTTATTRLSFATCSFGRCEDYCPTTRIEGMPRTSARFGRWPAGIRSRLETYPITNRAACSCCQSRPGNPSVLFDTRCRPARPASINAPGART
jgi:hypothetical protein